MFMSIISRMCAFLCLRPSYLIRLDDACETLAIEKWRAIESILDQHGMKPIVAVIPDNEDPSLHYSAKNELFWDEVKRWQNKGWSIAVHGYRHVYHSVEKKNLVFPFYRRSEFAGLSMEAQSELLRRALARLAGYGIYPDAWVAPGHCFDYVTLEALREATSIRVISDGIALFPYHEHGFTFIPQQLWWPKKKMMGIWTICLHPNTMSDAQIADFDQALTRLGIAGRSITLSDAVASAQYKSFISKVYAQLFWLRWNLRTMLR